MNERHTALRLVETKGLDRDEWLEVRKGGIGSSDAAAAVGLNPYKSPLELWMDKTGRTSANGEHAGFDDPRYWGTLLEPYVAIAYQQKTDRRVRKVNAVLQHPSFPFMLANIDREVIGSPEVQILECKTAGEFGSRLWRDGVPEYVQIQVQHQLAVTGKAVADVAVLLCGQELEIFRILRDEDVIARLIVLEARFWEHVETDTPPPADGSESSARALRQLYQGGGDTLDFSENLHLSQVLADLRAPERAGDQGSTGRRPQADVAGNDGRCLPRGVRHRRGGLQALQGRHPTGYAATRPGPPRHRGALHGHPTRLTPVRDRGRSCLT